MAKKEEVQAVEIIKKTIITTAPIVPVNHRDEFRKFFLQIQSKLKLNRDMEQVLWAHLVATKNDTVEKFKDGVIHFGYKL
jgi:hypothetical protein